MFGAYTPNMETQSQTRSRGIEPLGLRSVLTASLPGALLTADAPDRYTVEAVFTRRPLQEEIAEILAQETRDLLAQAGYPAVEVDVSDRRLEIANTSLEELRDGLASVLADRLARISAGVQAKHDAAALRFSDAAKNEQVRTAAVAALAESVVFPTPEQLAEQASASARADRAVADRAQIDDWNDEGGHGR